MPGKFKFARSGPVHFQSLEQELAPIARYLRGAMLNAGCGERDLAAYFRDIGVETLTNYDIASSLPGAVMGPLKALPFKDKTFDAVLCNAVLEHVDQAGAVTAELARVLKPGGHAVLAVPFLQPFHECPTDFQRYTRDGLVALGEAAGLVVVAINPVHSAAQTLGWIAWEIALEKGRLWQAIVWPLVYLWTRASLRTDQAILRNANTYQIVFVRPS
jgi:SAM-dependent methyltransferase